MEVPLHIESFPRVLHLLIEEGILPLEYGHFVYILYKVLLEPPVIALILVFILKGLELLNVLAQGDGLNLELRQHLVDQLYLLHALSDMVRVDNVEEEVDVLNDRLPQELGHVAHCKRVLRQEVHLRHQFLH